MPTDPTQPPLPPMSNGKSRLGVISKYTQSAVTILITLAVIYDAIAGIQNQPIINAFFLITGYYFSTVVQNPTPNL
jgi:hypothetical protein